MDSEEISEWMAREKTHPHWEPEYQTGLICATIANWSGHAKTGKRPENYMPARALNIEDQTPDEMADIMNRALAAK